jgi:hypothetical protein
VLRRRATRTPLTVHNVVFVVVFAAAALLTAVVLLIWLLG